jgi:NADPH:quinone reductase-like Zn-dependent oxidoreductase
VCRHLDRQPTVPQTLDDSVVDDVFGIASGAYAECAAAKEEKLAHKPSALSFEEAAVAAISGITALQALTDVGEVQAGQSVLIIGASSGVGSYAVQLAKALGATATGYLLLTAFGA